MEYNGSSFLEPPVNFSLGLVHSVYLSVYVEQGVQFLFSPICSYFLRIFLFSPIFFKETSYFSYFLAGKAKMRYKIKDGIILLYALERFNAKLAAE